VPRLKEAGLLEVMLQLADAEYRDRLSPSSDDVSAIKTMSVESLVRRSLADAELEGSS
jgi:hypothetical protein